ncbi:sugar phosphate isomerase/epimerase family protein [Cohnella rhizosphaerae]|uniref:Sugar phosphate isomerase/epimerase n=1 Tax=Cohnella rhizosphaerae TaxID=1457232 RepID=A0A9X4KXH0_9BACL|nr:TIM barrel protein [Cohnella rhizosphaerae]MDG0812568.1 sugar phosphate isomerase/epimerase [Cohnella rhizosphaerae]
MRIQYFKALWGMEGTLAEQVGRAAEAGYDGIEAPTPAPGQAEAFAALLERHGMAYIAQIFTSEDHAASFAERAAYAASFKPALIVSHSARDCMSEAEQDRFFEAALETEARLGVTVGHETHRVRAMFTPWTTARLLRKFPELRITADFSHWMTVCESHLEDQEENVSLAIERAVHIHGRIGYPEGPQVPHPAAPEYRSELELYLGWWGRILNAKRLKGEANGTFTAEFGPPGYMHTLPFTNAPVADLWEVNHWMTDCVRERFSQ